MELINEFIKDISESGCRMEAYKTINTIAVYVAALFGLLHGRKLKVGIVAVLCALIVEYLLFGPLATAIVYVHNGFTVTAKQNGPVVFPVIPLTAFLVSKLVRRNWKEIWDVLMPVPLLRFVVARIACTITGCCRGYPCSWGIYNPVIDDYVFPVQLLEAIVSILILIVVVYREKKNGFSPDGRNVPLILVSYGIARFFLEFLHDNEKIVFGCNAMSFHCLLMIAVGIITLYIIRGSERRIKRALIEEVSMNQEN